ncbi:uncharacterized protein SEPMUDRAFT_155439 [Sphaerulina musiva SO2202]|uniref:Uncharacterized protein n=1 Tax=Sphaerulina musiva (strain SO2202) TaxID=692275 RepID=M3DAB6_SPHMS|nr:uncharacterized protein SEPMUDRAFT_155439 [Sphaerulina musiva SO2202]EMF14814.1 hypothetical protein SEPMUDRAFT_155439 [Sphaerulina musiva SO2202]
MWSASSGRLGTVHVTLSESYFQDVSGRTSHNKNTPFTQEFDTAYPFETILAILIAIISRLHLPPELAGTRKLAPHPVRNAMASDDNFGPGKHFRNRAEYEAAWAEFDRARSFEDDDDEEDEDGGPSFIPRSDPNDPSRIFLRPAPRSPDALLRNLSLTDEQRRQQLQPPSIPTPAVVRPAPKHFRQIIPLPPRPPASVHPSQKHFREPIPLPPRPTAAGVPGQTPSNRSGRQQYFSHAIPIVAPPSGPRSNLPSAPALTIQTSLPPPPPPPPPPPQAPRTKRTKRSNNFMRLPREYPRPNPQQFGDNNTGALIPYTSQAIRHVPSHPSHHPLPPPNSLVQAPYSDRINPTAPANPVVQEEDALSSPEELRRRDEETFTSSSNNREAESFSALERQTDSSSSTYDTASEDVRGRRAGWGEILPGEESWAAKRGGRGM